MMQKSRLVTIFLIALWILVLSACGREQAQNAAGAPGAAEEGPAAEQGPAVAVALTDIPEEPPAPTHTPEPAATRAPTAVPEAAEGPSLIEGLGLAAGQADLDGLAELLVTVEELPEGWRASAVEMETNDGQGTYNPFCKEGWPARSIGKVAVDLQSGGLSGQYLTYTITVFESERDAELSYAEYKNAAAECPQWTNAQGSNFSLTPVSYPDYGDESFAVRINMGGAAADGVQIRVDNVLIHVLLIGEDSDQELQQTIIEAGLAKLEN